MSNKKIKQKPTQINIGTYQDVFSIITLLSTKQVYPNMPKRYLHEHFYRKIEVGIKYGRSDEYPERLYFCPEGFLGYSFMSGDVFTGAATYNLEDILDFLYTPNKYFMTFILS